QPHRVTRGGSAGPPRVRLGHARRDRRHDYVAERGPVLAVLTRAASCHADRTAQFWPIPRSSRPVRPPYVTDFPTARDGGTDRRGRLKNLVSATSFQPFGQLEVGWSGLDRVSSGLAEPAFRCDYHLCDPDPPAGRARSSRALCCVAILHRPLCGRPAVRPVAALLAQRFMDPAGDWARRCEPRRPCHLLLLRLLTEMNMTDFRILTRSDGTLVEVDEAVALQTVLRNTETIRQLFAEALAAMASMTEALLLDDLASDAREALGIVETIALPAIEGCRPGKA